MSEKPEVLDASALLAWLQNEPGADEVRLGGAVINSVNWSEVLQKAQQNGVDVADIREELEAVGLVFQAFSLVEAEKAAELYPLTRAYGLSLGDRACLATAAFLSGVAVTAERVWGKVEQEVSVRLIR